MRGIAGEVGSTSAALTDAGRPDDRMTERIRSRGPDGAGTWNESPVALGHRRLAIIDPSPAAAQPMIDQEPELVIVFNGPEASHPVTADTPTQ
jgi:asparagine synthase (glutamine-hydrolysing)